jgi:hypothetical protein
VKGNLEITDLCEVETIVIHIKLTLLMNVAGVVIQMGNLARPEASCDASL